MLNPDAILFMLAVLVTGMLGRTSATTKMLTNDFEEMGLDFGNVYQVRIFIVCYVTASGALHLAPLAAHHHH